AAEQNAEVVIAAEETLYVNSGGGGGYLPHKRSDKGYALSPRSVFEDMAYGVFLHCVAGHAAFRAAVPLQEVSTAARTKLGKDLRATFVAWHMTTAPNHTRGRTARTDNAEKSNEQTAQATQRGDGLAENAMATGIDGQSPVVYDAS